MSSTVLIFLLEYLPGFEDAFKSSLHILDNGENIVINKCEPTISGILWKEILANKMFDNLYKASSRSLSNDLDRLNLFKILNGIDNLIEVDKENTLNKNGKQNLTFNRTVLKATSEQFPANPPYLVAIFETLSNVTAQTCGGVLLTSHWVLTAAMCVNVLHNFYENGTNIGKSYNTVIVNATNPLVDGTVHNVSEIITHTKFKKYKMTLLVLMKITPGVLIFPIKLYKSSFVNNLDIMVYGWNVYKNGNGTDVMKVASFKSTTLHYDNCKKNNSVAERETIMCLKHKNQYIENDTQINSGGPVLLLRNNRTYLLGIALLDRITYVIPINQYYEWINYTLNS